MNYQGWWVGSFLCLIALNGCGKASSNGWSTFPVPIYSESSLASNASFQSDFQDAMTFWNEKAGKQLFAYQGSYQGATPYTGNVSDPTQVTNNVVFFQNPWPFTSTIVGQTMVTALSQEIQAAMVMVNPTTQFCTGDCANISGLTSERKVLAHELGHFLGLQHVQDPANLMYPTSLPGGSLSDVTIDENAFQALTTGGGR